VYTGEEAPTEAAKTSGLGESLLSTGTPVSHKLPLSLAMSSTSFIPAQVSPIKSLSTNTDIASFLLEAYAIAPNKSEQFKVHVLGDCHIVMRPPHWFTKMKRPPPLRYKISRKADRLEHKISSLFDGVYALRIPREEAYGILDVFIWTESKPLVKESFEVDFGSSWLKTGAWRRAISAALRNDLNLVQTMLKTVCDHTKAELTVFVNSTIQEVAAQREAGKAVLSSHLQRGTRTKVLILAQSKELTRSFSVKLHSGAIHASKQLKAVKNNFSLYTQTSSFLIAQQARALAQPAMGVDVRALTDGIWGFRLKYLRGLQKSVLKTWWKIGGMPKQRARKLKGNPGFCGRKGR